MHVERRLLGFRQDGEPQPQLLAGCQPAGKLVVEQKLPGRLFNLATRPTTTGSFEVSDDQLTLRLDDQVDSPEQIRAAWHDLPSKFFLNAQNHPVWPRDLARLKCRQHAPS
jgi:hypothetical protein